MDATAIITAGQFAGLIALFIFIWRIDKRSEGRTKDLRKELGTRMGNLQEGQTHLQEGQTQILARVGNLEMRVGNLETRMSKLEEGQATLAEGQAALALEWAKAEIRLKHLEENAVTTQGKIDEISELSHQTNAKTASLDGLIRGYFIREGDILHETAAAG